MTRATATAIFTAELAATGNGAPEWIELFPAGPDLVAVDGRKWTANPSAVVAAFAARNGRPLPVDYEHAQYIKAGTGDETPAAGWIVAVEDRAGAVWGKVEWTPRAARLIADREYRYVSPEFQRAEDGLILQLDGAALVNRPALETLTALAARQQTQGATMKTIATALGLAETADEAGILARLTEQAGERTALCAALKLDGSADHAAVLAAIAALQEAAPAATELAAVKASLDTATARIAELETAGHRRDVDAALDEATAQGKITPATRDTYREMCADAAGLARFRALAAKLPVIADPSRLDGKPGSAADNDGEISARELATRARKYQQEQHAAGNAISISAAVAHVQQEAQK